MFKTNRNSCFIAQNIGKYLKFKFKKKSSQLFIFAMQNLTVFDVTVSYKYFDNQP